MSIQNSSVSDSRLNIANQYVFRGETGTVLLMTANSSLAWPISRAGFHPEARYEFKVHRNAEVSEDLTYRITFGPQRIHGQQHVRLEVLAGLDATDDSASGNVLVHGLTGDVLTGADGLRLWTGRAIDPYYADLMLLRAMDRAVNEASAIPRWTGQTAKNDFEGSTIHAIVLEVADSDPDLPAGVDVKVWSTSKVLTDNSSSWSQITRQGHPIIRSLLGANLARWTGDQGLVDPSGERDGDERQRLARQVAGFVAANRTTDDPAAYGAMVSELLLPDALPYRTGTSANFGFARWNGRALSDNAPEVMLSLILNAAVTTGLSAGDVTGTTTSSFPYLVAQPPALSALPHE
jgi:hypothetical protein